MGRRGPSPRRYGELLGGEPLLQLPVEKPYARNVYWMYHVQLRGPVASMRREVLGALAERGIDTREGFIPANQQEIFQGLGWASPDDCPKANAAGEASFYLPSGPVLAEDDLEYVAHSLREVLRGASRSSERPS